MPFKSSSSSSNGVRGEQLFDTNNFSNYHCSYYFLCAILFPNFITFIIVAYYLFSYYLSNY